MARRTICESSGIRFPVFLVVKMSSEKFNFAGLAKDYDHWYETPEGNMYDQAEKSTVLKLLRPAKPVGGRD